MQHRRFHRHVKPLATLNRGIVPVAAALFLGHSQFSQAAPQPATWTGANTGGDGVSWNSADNWTTNMVADVLPPNTSPGDDLTFGTGTPGTINLDGNEIADSLTFNANGFILDSAPSTDTLTNTTGTINVGAGDTTTINASLAGSSGLRLFGTGVLILDNADVYTSATTLNAGTLVVGAASALNPSGVLTVDSGAALLVNTASTATVTFGTSVGNSGNFTISSNDTFNINATGGVFTQSGGTLTVNGALSTGGDGFNYSGGSVVGTVTIGSNSASPTFSLGAGAGNSGTFIITGEGATFSGGVPRTIQSNQSVTFAPTAASGTLTSSSNISNVGSLTLSGASTSLATLSDSSSTLTNTGIFTTSANSTPSTVTDFVTGNLVNSATGTANINASTTLSSGAVANNGTFDIASGVTFNLPGLAAAGGINFTQSAGSLTINGSLDIGFATFNDNGGAVTGTVTLGSSTVNATALSFGSSAGNSGTFLYNGGGAVSGSVPTGVAVIFQPTATNPEDLNLPAGFVNNGTLELVGSGAAGAVDTFSFSVGSPSLTNNGTLTVSNSSSPSTANQAIDVPVTSSGTINVNADLTMSASLTINRSTSQVNVAAGAVLNLTGQTFNLDNGAVTLAAGTSPAVLKLGTLNYAGGPGSPMSGTIASGPVGSGQSPGYVDLSGATQTMSVGVGSPAPQLTISAPVTDGGISKTGGGTLELTGNNTYALGTTVSAGALVIGAANALPATGTVTLQTGGLMQLSIGIGQATTQALSIDSTSDLDITNNSLIINYGSGPDPISSVISWIKAGYNGGAWNGAGGIISSMAANNSGSYGIGYADAADPNNPANLSSGQIEVMYTLLGDANLDGKVNGADFTILASNFNQGGKVWDQGDFNYDGNVNGDDFTLLAESFNQSAVQSAVGAADLAALDAFAAANGISLTTVPEPTSGALALILTAGMLRARIRRPKIKSS